ncbi:metalloregulator ArsR/SmtB family transcription factor [Candidatus Albibeggiatoa sp. nov. NOAA]|uniref:ArsR/SmtB family transcription factor n=1 Tax=Candidatus Albibeggiatoa sp. nov. NOAA TaxID=3162724 RepID=UPI0033011C58|nr:metalloregulator ArsR/SmtB family transcription factor [Thiotrichaceae bacterium]
MNLEDTAKALKELGHPTRLSIFRILVTAGHKGLPVGTLQKELDMPGSTLSHHISGLSSAGLITQRREGRTLFCTVEYERLQSVIDFLLKECCVNE